MSAILKVEDLVPNALGGGGGGHTTPYLATMGIGGIEIVPPSEADELRYGAKTIAHHLFREGHPVVPVTKSIAKSFISAAACDPGVMKVAAPTPMAVYTHYGRAKRFRAGVKVRTKLGAKLLAELDIDSREFYVYFQPCKFSDVDIDAGCAALRVGTGLPVVTLNEVQILRLRQEYLDD